MWRRGGREADSALLSFQDDVSLVGLSLGIFFGGRKVLRALMQLFPAEVEKSWLFDTVMTER